MKIQNVDKNMQLFISIIIILVEITNCMDSTTPWKDERWLPGVLNKRQMISLMKAHLLLNADENIDEDASALDLHLTDECYKMIKGSIKPFNKSYHDIISDTDYAKRIDKETDKTFLLHKEECYLFRIKERLHSCIKTSPIYGQATAKSSVGRVDVIARLIVDGMKEYEKFNPNEVDTGEMFLEITPITFDVKVKENISISQLRFFYGRIEHALINDEDFIHSILNLRNDEMNHGTLAVDISNTPVDEAKQKFAAAYRAQNEILVAIELGRKVDEKEKYPQKEFWECITSIEKYNLKSIEIEEGRFYILRSKERISLPEGICIYCRAMDETLGEMRIHYAGFVHPLFGDKRKESNKKGTPLIFEVRGHNVKVLLTHGEILARLFFYRMSENVDKNKFYKIEEENKNQSQIIDSYNEQELNLSNLFQKYWY